MERKFCKKCKRNLPINYFGNNKGSRDGLSFYCLTCYRKIRDNYNVRRQSTTYKIFRKLKNFLFER
jgi:RNase P subunit RPR2